jgi:hypothetical protein
VPESFSSDWKKKEPPQTSSTVATLTDPRQLSATVDAINTRLGRDTVFFAASGVERKWKVKREMLSSRYTTCWNELLVVK